MEWLLAHWYIIPIVLGFTFVGVVAYLCHYVLYVWRPPKEDNQLPE